MQGSGSTRARSTQRWLFVVLIEAEEMRRSEGLAAATAAAGLGDEDTYSDGGEDDFRGRHEDGVGKVAAAKRFVTSVVEG